MNDYFQEMCCHVPMIVRYALHQVTSVTYLKTLFKVSQWRAGHAAPKEFKNGGFSLKTYQMFSACTMTEEFDHRSFCICVWGKLGKGNRKIIVTTSFSKSYVYKMFSVYTKRRHCQFCPVCGTFSWRIRVDGSSSRRNKECVFKLLRRSVDAAYERLSATYI